VRLTREVAVRSFTIQFPFVDFIQWRVKPRKSKVPGQLPSWRPTLGMPEAMVDRKGSATAASAIKLRLGSPSRIRLDARLSALEKNAI
jgi:hypothetical protein